MKGISAIMATIILLLITIALAGAAYMFIMGYFTGRMDVMLEPVPEAASCDINDNVYIYVRNVGTTTLTKDKVIVLKDGTNEWTGTICDKDGDGADDGETDDCFTEDLTTNTPVKYDSSCTTTVCKYQFVPDTGQGTSITIYCP